MADKTDPTPETAHEELDEHADPDNFGIGATSTPPRTSQVGCEPGRASRASMRQLARRHETLQTGGDPSTVVPEIATRR